MDWFLYDNGFRLEMVKLWNLFLLDFLRATFSMKRRRKRTITRIKRYKIESKDVAEETKLCLYMSVKNLSEFQPKKQHRVSSLKHFQLINRVRSIFFWRHATVEQLTDKTFDHHTLTFTNINDNMKSKKSNNFKT